MFDINIDEFVKEEDKYLGKITVDGEEIKVEQLTMREMLKVVELAELLNAGKIDDIEGMFKIIEVVIGKDVLEKIIDKVPITALQSIVGEIMKSITGKRTVEEEEDIKDDGIEVDGEVVKIPSRE